MFFVVVLDKLTKEKPEAPADKPGSGDGKQGPAPAAAPATEPA